LRRRFGNSASGAKVMPHRQTVEFLRRRYAAAILCDDADTAGRLRAQLDGIMNPVGSGGRRGDAARAAAQARPLEALARPRDALLSSPEPPARPQAERSPEHGQLAPRLRLVTPVTGLLEWPARRL
jgi:hypothetical protein